MEETITIIVVLVIFLSAYLYLHRHDKDFKRKHNYLINRIETANNLRELELVYKELIQFSNSITTGLHYRMTLDLWQSIEVKASKLNVIL